MGCCWEQCIFFGWSNFPFWRCERWFSLDVSFQLLLNLWLTTATPGFQFVSDFQEKAQLRGLAHDLAHKFRSISSHIVLAHSSGTWYIRKDVGVFPSQRPITKILIFFADAWFVCLRDCGSEHWCFAKAVLNGNAWWCLVMLPSPFHGICFLFGVFPPLILVPPFFDFFWIVCQGLSSPVSFVHFLASSIFFWSKLSIERCCFAIHTHSILLILITLGPKLTRLQSLKLCSCIVLETSSMDQTWSNTIARIMPTTSQGVEHHGNLRPPPPNPRIFLKALFGDDGGKKHPLKLPFKF